MLRLAISILLLALSLVLGVPTPAATFQAKVVSVIDGDTLNIANDGRRTKVILYGVDCPELGQDFGEQARKFTDDCCWRKTVTLEQRGQDSLGREIAVIWLSDGTNLNEELVKRGLAWWSDKYAPRDNQLRQLQIAAQAAHSGLWCAPNPIPPWIWRNGQKEVHATIKPGT